MECRRDPGNETSQVWGAGGILGMRLARYMYGVTRLLASFLGLRYHPVFYCLQYKRTEGEGLGDLVTCMVM